jgi:hypothetical protein
MTLNQTSRTLLVVVAISVIAALGWRLASPSNAKPTAPAAVAHAETVAPNADPAVNGPTPRARLLAAEQQVRSTPDSACAMPAPSVASGVDPDDPAVQAAFMRRPDVVGLVKGIRHIDDSLRASADPFTKAVALWLDVPRMGDDSEGIPDGERQRLLATMAATTTDPRVYALAFRTCSGSSEAACQALSARRWAVLDPGNAVPWLFLLNDAERARDASGQQEAWFHVAAATRFDERAYSQMQPVLAAADDTPDNLRAAEVLSVMGIGIAAGQTIAFGPLLKGCRDAALADANRAQLCTKVADLMFDHSDTPITRQFGASMTRRLTGDNRRNDQVAEEMKFWIANDPVAPQGCAELHRQLDVLRSLSTRGPHGTYAAMKAGEALH